MVLSRRQLLGLGVTALACELGRERSVPAAGSVAMPTPPAKSACPVVVEPDPRSRPRERALMRHFPRLAERLDWVTLTKLPTPVERAAKLEVVAGLGPLFVKRDDLSDAAFGGGKPRKLELLLGEAIARGFERVVTFGGAGSNQALGTAVHGRRLGLGVRLELAAQPPGEDIAAKLRSMLRTGAEMKFIAGTSDAESRARRELVRRGRAAPWVIPIGGTSALGNLAFVDAALELADQVRAGIVPEPDTLYVAGGTLGTAVGLCLGVHLGGLGSQVVAVRASSPSLSSAGTFGRLLGETVRYARSLDPAFPSCTLRPGAFAIDPSELGAGYGYPTEHGRAARALALATQQWRLDDTYTAKMLAAVLARKTTGVSLVWLTQSAAPLVEAGDASLLPAPLARYLDGSTPSDGSAASVR